MSTAGTILVCIGVFINVFCTIALIYIDNSFQLFLKMDSSFYKILMSIGCIFLIITVLLDFSKNTVFNALVWILTYSIWTSEK